MNNTLVLLLALACSARAASPFISIDNRPERGELQLAYKGKTLLVYAYATNQFKPYVRELYTLQGENVLRDAPPDHLHHHGMMYAVWVNGVNFWEERGTPGIQRHIEILHTDTSDEGGVPVAYFTELIHWLSPSNRTTPLLIERRTLSVGVDVKNQEVALHWDGQFQVSTQAGKVTISGPNYVGLGLRLPESFNHVATFQNSAALPYSAQNTQNVIPAHWTSVSGALGGHDVMLIFFGRADNPRGEARFFSMLDPFAYLSATQGLDKQPIEYAAGENFTLSYLLTVCSEKQPSPFIQNRWALWEKERR